MEVKYFKCFTLRLELCDLTHPDKTLKCSDLNLCKNAESPDKSQKCDWRNIEFRLFSQNSFKTLKLFFQKFEQISSVNFFKSSFLKKASHVL